MSTHAHIAPAATLTIDLDAIARNYLYLKNLLGPGADCAAVVKADAYGLGMPPVATTLHQQNCRHFFVATVDEGADLRAILPDADTQIYVLHGPAGTPAGTLAAHRLIPVLNTPDDLACWQIHARTTDQPPPCILHIDTGINRLGLTARSIETLAADKTALAALDVRYVMSHLACADAPENPMNAAQLDMFHHLTSLLNLPARYSMANTGGILLGPDYHFDLVRPGCGLYGMNVHNTPQNPFQNVATVMGRVLQTSQIDSGSTVGYGATYRVKNPVKTATISVGYADGLFRSLTGKGYVYFQGTACPIIGRVSMDSIVVDVSAITVPVKAGDMAEIIGPSQTIDTLAAQAGTIGYEVLTALGQRYYKIYKGTQTHVDG